MEAREKMLNNTTIVAVPANGREAFYTMWVEFLAPLHRLPQPARKLMVALLCERESIVKKVSDKDAADALLLVTSTRKRICSSIGITQSYFNHLLFDLRRCKAVVGDRINPRFIPHEDKPGENYRLLVEFRMDGKA